MSRCGLLRSAFHSKATAESSSNSCDDGYNSQRKSEPEGGSSQAANSHDPSTLDRRKLRMVLLFRRLRPVQDFGISRGCCKLEIIVDMELETFMVRELMACHGGLRLVLLDTTGEDG